MKNTRLANSLAEFNRLLGLYEQSLNQYSEEQFLTPEAPGAWSMGQMCVHLAGSTKYFALKNIETCLAPGAPAKGSKNLYGWLVFTLRAMPAIRIKVPIKKGAEVPQPENIAAIRNKFNEARLLMSQAAMAIEAAGSPAGKTKHPVMGYLNALEWFESNEFHWKHHLRQKKRIDRALGDLIG